MMRVFIQRAQRAQVDHLGVDVVLLGQLLRGLQHHLGDFALA